MGPAYHKGVPLLGVPENPIDLCRNQQKNVMDYVARKLHGLRLGYDDERNSAPVWMVLPKI